MNQQDGKNYLLVYLGGLSLSFILFSFVWTLWMQYNYNCVFRETVFIFFFFERDNSSRCKLHNEHFFKFIFPYVLFFFCFCLCSVQQKKFIFIKRINSTCVCSWRSWGRFIVRLLLYEQRLRHAVRFFTLCVRRIWLQRLLR
jgi:hypothetical protein